MTYLEKEWQAVVDAELAYMAALKELQESCEHRTILKHTDSSYRTVRVCEDCGYSESAQWDSPYKYKDQRLLERAYDVRWEELVDAQPRLRESEVLYHSSRT